jgi:pimeloyl-ACP methyl ester carboxylesterase
MTQLILLPGLASDARMWQDQLAVLPERWCPHVTDVHARHTSINDMAATLLEEHPGDLVLCGASMGGIIAMEVARQAPQRIRGLALLGTNARPETDDVRQLREAAITFFEQGRALEVLRLNVPLAFHASRMGDTRLTQAYLDFVMAAGTGQLVRQNRAIIGRPDARLHLPTLTCPVLVLCGDADQLTPPECSREIAALVPHAEFALVPDCGHMLTMERPEVVNPALLGWLETLQVLPR